MVFQYFQMIETTGNPANVQLGKTNAFGYHHGLLSLQGALFKTSISRKITSGNVSVIKGQAELSNLFLIFKMRFHHYRFLICLFLNEWNSGNNY